MLHKKVTPLAVPLIVIVMVIAFFNPRLQAGPDSANAASDLAKPVLLTTDAKSIPSEIMSGQDKTAPDVSLPASNFPMNPLYPDTLDPPESCGVPRRGPFGEDAELLLVDPAGLYQLEQLPEWEKQLGLPGYEKPIAEPDSEISAVAVSGGQMFSGGLIYAVWRDTYEEFGVSVYSIVESTWPDSWGAPRSVMAGQDLDLGNPVALARGSNRGFFIRQDTGILCKDYDQAAAQWLPGLVGNASTASDPAVIAKDSEHVAIFYRDSQGGVWLTERFGTRFLCTGGRWRQDPVSLSGATLIKKNEIYLPMISGGQSTSLSKTIYGPAEASSRYQLAAAPSFTLASELSAASRNENHMAVFGVNADNELWVKEWTHLHESDWRDTEWVKLMDNVEIERPSVASRHMNHLGVAVRDATTHQATIIEWSNKNGWTDPVPLGNGVAGNLNSPLTLLATAKDAMSLFTVEQGEITYRNWTEQAGWEQWSALAGTSVADSQRLTAVVRAPNEVMLLGKDPAGNGMMKYLIALGEPLTQSPVDVPAPTMSNGYRGQSLAWVDGEMLLATPKKDNSVDQWQVDFRSLFDGDELTHDLPDHTSNPDGASDRDMAAGNLDSDGNDELVFVSTPQISNQWQVDISILNIEISPTLSVDTLTSTTFTMEPYGGAIETTSVWDVNVAIGDLDGDGIEDEVAIAFFPRCDVEAICWQNRYIVVNLFEIEVDPHTNAMQLADRGKRVIGDTERGCYINGNLHGFQEWCQIEDLEFAIGKVVETDPKEQLIIGDYLFRAFIEGGDRFDEESFIGLYRVSDDSLDKDTWEIIRNPWPLDWWSSPITFNLLPWRDPNPGEIITLEVSDMDADGVEELIHLGDGAESMSLFVFEFVDGGYEHPIANRGIFNQDDFPTPYPTRMAVGDLNQDGIDEIALIYNWTIDNGLSYYSNLSVYELVSGRLINPVTSMYPRNDISNILIGDLDNDSLMSDLVGCAQIGEVSVVAVLNGPPRWYRAGEPVHDMAAAYAKSITGGTEETTGTESSIGASLSVGMEVETNIPFGGPTFAVRASVTDEIMATMGCSSSRTTSVTEEEGFSYGDSPGEGFVIFNTFLYKCNYYDLYAPATPETKTRAMACQPIGCHPASCHETVASLADWHAPTFKSFAGASWVDLGHHSDAGVVTNLVTTYPDKLPVDPETLKFMKKDPIPVKRSENPITKHWTYTESEGGAAAETSSFNNNTTISTGMTAGYVTVDVSTTIGFGSEKSQSTSWDESLGITAGVQDFSNPNPDFQCYEIVPYLYHAKARTLGGTSYEYLALDWYVPTKYPCPY